ncbi:MAG: phage terminase large subunit [Scytolyngbya sp. HA4215-MV1]|nr:phage terminase large subunit [Scytolyngbya sp. HA4215-MV1]
MATVKQVKPQAGPQTAFLSSGADFVLYGGARGGGKTFAALLEPLRHVNVPGFNAVIFRRTYPQITNAGGLWDKSTELYPSLGAKPSLAKCQWDFPAGTTIAFRHLKLEEHKFDWQGLQICLLMFEELTHFSKSQFIFLMGSNRSTCGVRPYIRATCNPDADSWVKDLVKPFLAEDGYVDLDQVGTIKHLIIEDEQFKFVDESYRDELGNPPISFTYISADVWDNEELLKKDPGYLRNLMAQSAVDRDRFLGIKGRGGNWNIKASAGKLWRPHWVEIVDTVPQFIPGRDKMVRFWDLAATAKKVSGNDPDFTAGAKLARINGTIYILDYREEQVSPLQVDRMMRNTAIEDGVYCLQRWEQEHGGSAGIRDSAHRRQLLAGFDAMGVLPRGDKVARFSPFSSACEFGEVKMLRGGWNTRVINGLSLFPDGKHDEDADTHSGAYNELMGTTGMVPATTGQMRI